MSEVRFVVSRSHLKPKWPLEDCFRADDQTTDLGQFRRTQSGLFTEFEGLVHCLQLRCVDIRANSVRAVPEDTIRSHDFEEWLRLTDE